MKKLSIGKCNLGKFPKIAAVIDRPISVSALKKIKADGADILEIRADLFKCPFLDTIAFTGMVRETVKLPVIATIRENTEIKAGEQRKALFAMLIPMADAIDVEINALDSSDIIEMAQGKTIIVSEHDFKKTPSDTALSSIIKKAKTMGADIIKIAAMASSAQDAARLMCYTANSRENLVMISMGEYGASTRLSAFLFGSLYTYCFTSASVAPGQLSLKETSSILTKMYPGLRSSG